MIGKLIHKGRGEKRTLLERKKEDQKDNILSHHANLFQ